RPVGRDQLAALFWSDETLSKGRGNLRRELHNLSRILPDCWLSDRQMVQFIPSKETTVDLQLLIQLEQQERWREAAELVGGEFLEGLYLENNLDFEYWLSGERERWRERSKAILRRVIDSHLRRGHYADALEHAQRLLQLAPWDEDAHRHIMRLQAWTGQRGAALRQFAACQQVLKEELEVDPAPETIALYEQVLTGSLDIPPLLPAFLASEDPRRSYEQPLFVGRGSELQALDSFLEEAVAGRSCVVFVAGDPGRGKTALLEAFAQRAMASDSELLVAGGKCHSLTGAGDPYLPFREILAMLTGDVEGRWDAGAITRDHAQRLWLASSFAAQLLLEQGRNLLDVFVGSAELLSRMEVAEPANPPWLANLRTFTRRDGWGSEDVEQVRLFQQFTKILLAISLHQPLLLFLDDLQWADTASINLLFHLGRNLADAAGQLLIICAYRPEEVGIDRDGARHPLAKVLNEFKRSFGDVWLDLGRTDEAEERAFIDALLDSEPNELTGSFKAALHIRTRGHPLFTVELLRAMQNRGDLVLNEKGAWTEGPSLDWQQLPARVEAAIRERIDRLDPDLLEILTIASVEGEVFTSSVVAEVQKIPSRMLLGRLSQELDRRHRLIREQEEVETAQKRMSRYSFSHILFRDYLYHRLSKAEKRELHGEVAAAVEMLYADQLEEMAVRLAHHYQKAGDAAKAFHFSALAGGRAARLYDSGEAIVYFTQALQLADQLSPSASNLCLIRRGRGQARERIGDFEGARSDLHAVLDLTQASGDQHLQWRACIDLGRLWTSRDYLRARDYLEKALELARKIDDPALLAESLNWLGNWHANDADPTMAVEHHKEALNICEQTGVKKELANTLDLLALASMLGGDLSESLAYYDRAVAFYRELGHRTRLASSLTGRATTVSALSWLGSAAPRPAPDARADFSEALRIARKIDAAPIQAWAHYSLGMLHTVRGCFGQALETIQKGLRIASDAGHLEYVVGCRYALGMLYLELFAFEQAKSLLQEALSLVNELGSKTWHHMVAGSLAALYFRMGEPQAAQAILDSVLSDDTPMDTLGRRYCWIWRAELAMLNDQPELTLGIAGRLIDSAPGIKLKAMIPYLWKLKGQALAQTDQADEACVLFSQAVEGAQATGEKFLLWRLHQAHGQLLQTMGQRVEAEIHLIAARASVDELASSIPDEVLRSGFLKGFESAASTSFIDRHFV
ncbi:MAG: tetratricopeptide repeat protein, partial [Candidatus Promineifilaceae bacterium]